MTKAVMMIKESEASEVINDLKDVVSKEPVLIKIVPDTDFNLMFGKTVEEKLDIPQDLLLTAAMEAHKNDITLNQQLNRVLSEAIKKEVAFEKKLKPKADTSVEINEAIDELTESRLELAKKD